ncbi:MAG: glycosyltransferase family 4 protein, partial [bacterium]|nr:glycosyltransferase family 4 protein [bacterium]
MADIPKRIALVYDRVNKWGGAERVLLALHELFPQAPLYTAVYNPQSAGWARVFPAVIPSWLQHAPGASTRHELYPWLTPLAFESFDFKEYDAVISISSADAKGILTQPGTFHLCYCLTPTRYLWSHAHLYQSQVSDLASPIFSYLKQWDKIASHRPDAYVAISKTVQERITNYYGLPSTVVYPPVDVQALAKTYDPPVQRDYFLWVGRLVAYKRAQLIVETFNDLQLPLVIIGLGDLADKLKQMARANIHLL